MSMSRPARILYVEMAYGFGGSIVSLYQLVRGMDRSAYEPVVLFYRPNAYVARFQEIGTRVIVLRPGERERAAGSEAAPQRRTPAWRKRLAEVVAIGRQVWGNTGPLLQLMRQEQIDLVHLNDVLISNREGIIAAWLAGIPCLSHVRAFEQLTLLDRYLARRVGAFVYISQAIRRAHEAQGTPPTRGRVIYNALDIEEFAGDRLAARARLGLRPEDQVVGIVGRLVAWKGHRVFLEAMARLVPSRPNLRCLVVGEGESTEPTYPAELERLAARLGLAERVTFTGYQAGVATLLPALDVLIHCSLQPEPFGRVIIEGMAAGVPVVGAADGAVPEIIEDGRTGLLVPPGDAERLAEAVGRLLDDSSLAASICRAARRRVEEAFSVDAHVRQIQEVYRLLLKGKT